MIQYEFQYATQIQLEVTLEGHSVVNEGVSFEVPPVFADYVTVDSTGVVTPILTPPHGIMGVIVEAKVTATGEDVKKFVLVVHAGADHTVTISIVPTP
jgi:hypothetical protein